MLASLTAVAVIMPQATAGPTIKRIKTFDQFRVTAVASAPTGSRFAFATEDAMVRIMDSKTVSTVVGLKGHPDQVFAIAFNPKGTLVATADARARIWIWDAKTGAKVRELPRDKGHVRAVSALAFSNDGTRIASVGQDDVIKIWKTAGGHPVGTILGSGANFYGVSFTPSGSLVTGTLAEGARIYSTKTWSLAARLTLPGGQGANGIGINSKGTFVTAGRDGRVTLWNLSARSRAGTLVGHTDWAINAAVAPNGKVAASSSSDQTVRLWNLKTLKPIAVLEGQSYVGSPICFTADGRCLVTCSSSDSLQVYAINPPQNK